MRADVDPDDRLLATFLELVRIDSPTGHERACALYCASALEAAGCTVEFDDAGAVIGSDIGNMRAVLPGTVDATLVLSAHFDVVEPCRGVEPVVADGLVFSAGDTVLGSDDKAGLAAAIECVRRISGSTGPRPTIVCLFTVQEEVGLEGAKQLDPSWIAGDLCLVLDAAGPPGGIVTAAPTHYVYRARFAGVPAHAGVEPEKGVSAITVAADALVHMPHGRLDEGTTSNPGTIKGGSATNVVAATVELTGECRSLNRDTVETLRGTLDREMREAARRAGAAVEIEWECQFEGFGLADDDPMVELVEQACRDAGLTPRTYATGGGSDANVIAQLGSLPVLALACGMDAVHGTHEQVRVSDLSDLTSLCLAVAHRMADAAGRDGDRA